LADYTQMQNDSWFRPLVWTDYRLAILFTIIVPLILLIWAIVQKADAMQRLLMIYWRVASLLAITLYLMLAAFPIGFLSSFLARILIPISLWFWVDINEEIDDQPQRPLKLAFTSWRWAITAYSVLGALALIPFLSCGFATNKQALLNNPLCAVWLEAPFLYKQYFHPNTKPEFLGFLALVGLIVYVLSLSYFVLIRLGKQGRSAMQ